MAKLILILIIIGIIGYVGEKLYNGLNILTKAVGNTSLIVIIILAIIAYFAYSWEGVFIVACVGLGYAYFARNAIKHSNQKALEKELFTNCQQLGYMTPKDWVNKLPNYSNRIYETSFEEITNNFSIQMEFQHITSNDSWFDEYLLYITNNSEGVNLDKLLSEVKSSAMTFTHPKEDKSYIISKLEESLQQKESGPPALLYRDSLNLYTPSPYLKKIMQSTDVPTSNRHNTIDVSNDSDFD